MVPIKIPVVKNLQGHPQFAYLANFWFHYILDRQLLLLLLEPQTSLVKIEPFHQMVI